MGMNFVQGKYQLMHPGKYRGNAKDVVFRSSYELAVFKFLDSEPSIAAWSSETLVIPYRSPVDGAMHRYFTDLRIWANSKDGLKQFVIEIKPSDQTVKPRRGKKSDKTFLNEVATYAVNQAKWAAAREWCRTNGAEFIIWTEKEIFPNLQTKKYKQPKKVNG